MPADANRTAWEDWGRVDPLWAVLTSGERYGRWDLDRFFRTGLEAAGWALEHAETFGRPENHGTALDFGCGVGRLTRAIAPRFECTYGLDIASSMIEQARRFDMQRGPSGAKFVVHDRPDLSHHASGSVDFVLSLLVLQHLPSTAAIAGYLGEFVRVLSTGGIAVVHLPSQVPATSQGPEPLRMRARGWLRAAGVSPRFLYRRLGWQPDMPMSAVPYNETVAIIEGAGGQVLDAPETSIGDGVVNRIYFFTATTP